MDAKHLLSRAPDWEYLDGLSATSYGNTTSSPIHNGAWGNRRSVGRHSDSVDRRRSRSRCLLPLAALAAGTHGAQQGSVRYRSGSCLAVAVHAHPCLLGFGPAYRAHQISGLFFSRFLKLFRSHSQFAGENGRHEAAFGLERSVHRKCPASRKHLRMRSLFQTSSGHATKLPGTAVAPADAKPHSSDQRAPKQGA